MAQQCAEANMALRILSGMIFIPRGGSARGSVQISFNPFRLTNSSNPVIELRKEQEIGPRERFVRRPVSMVAARQFAIMAISDNPRVKLNDTVTRDSIRIGWSTSARTARVDQEEIPFLIIGEVPDFVPISKPTRLIVKQPSDIMRGRANSSKKSKRGRRASKKRR
jgi:hypothetical protein